MEFLGNVVSINQPSNFYTDNTMSGDGVNTSLGINNFVYFGEASKSIPNVSNTTFTLTADVPSGYTFRCWVGCTVGTNGSFGATRIVSYPYENPATFQMVDAQGGTVVAKAGYICTRNP